MSTQPVEFPCPHCNARLRIRDWRLMGRSIDCPDCTQPVELVPDGRHHVVARRATVPDMPAMATSRQNADGTPAPSGTLTTTRTGALGTSHRETDKQAIVPRLLAVATGMLVAMAILGFLLSGSTADIDTAKSNNHPANIEIELDPFQDLHEISPDVSAGPVVDGADATQIDQSLIEVTIDNADTDGTLPLSAPLAIDRTDPALHSSRPPVPRAPESERGSVAVDVVPPELIPLPRDLDKNLDVVPFQSVSPSEPPMPRTATDSAATDSTATDSTAINIDHLAPIAEPVDAAPQTLPDAVTSAQKQRMSAVDIRQQFDRSVIAFRQETPATLTDILRVIEELAAVEISFSDNIPQSEREYRLTFSEANATIVDILRRVLEPVNLEYRLQDGRIKIVRPDSP